MSHLPAEDLTHLHDNSETDKAAAADVIATINFGRPDNKNCE